MTELGDRMRALANTGHERAFELRAKAQEFDDKTNPAEGEWSAKSMLGAWARARKLWCEITGEPLA